MTRRQPTSTLIPQRFPIVRTPRMPHDQRSTLQWHTTPTPPPRSPRHGRRALRRPHPNPTPTPRPAPRRSILSFAPLGATAPRNARPHRQRPIFPPAHRAVELSDCARSGIPQTGLSIRTRAATTASGGCPSGPARATRSPLAGAPPLPPRVSSALSPSSLALSLAPCTTGALRPPCPPQVSPPTL